MNVVAERWCGLDRGDDVLLEVTWVRGGEADTANTRDPADRDEQLREGHLTAGILVRVDVLAEELNVSKTFCSHAAGFCKNGVSGAAAFLAAGVWDYAVGTEFVTAFDNGDVSAMFVGACGELGI